MSAKPKIIISDRIYIPSRDIDLEDVAKRYARRLYSEGDCRKCDNRSERHNYLCDECPAYQGHIILHKEKGIGSEHYVGIPLGDRAEIGELFDINYDDYKIVDKRVDKDFKYEVTTDLVPRPHQKTSIKKWVKKGYGVLKAPPRSGKCVDGNTLIHTDSGTMRMEDLFAGIPFEGEEQLIEQKFGILGDEGRNVTANIYRKRVDSTVAIRTHNGFVIRGIDEHPLLVLTPELELLWKYMKDIEEGDYLCISRKHSLFTDKRFSIKPVSTKHHNERSFDYPLIINESLARVLGYLTANGDFSGDEISFTSNNRRVQKDFLACFTDCFGVTPDKRKQDRADNFRVHSTFICRVLESYGLSLTVAAEKQIPVSVLRSDKAIQTAFLESYFSCDAYTANNAVQLCSASRELIRQLHVVLANFGIIGKRFSKMSFARNSENAIERRYYYIDVGGLDNQTFHECFDLLKDVSVGNNVRSPNDFVPYIGKALRDAYEAKRDGKSTVVVIDGVRHFNFRLFKSASMDKCKKDYLGYNMFNDIDTENLRKLDANLFSTVKLLARKGYYFDPVVAKTKIQEESFVYDVTVPKAHHYIGNGIVSHNTPTMLMISVQLGKRTLMLASQKEFLDQFLDHVEKFTNLPELQEQTGKKLYGYIKKEEDLKDLQIAVSPYQKFMSEKGQKLWKKVCKHFGILWIDECFPAGTGVLMADGKVKPIESLTKGDIVQSYSKDGKIEPNEVTHTFHTARDVLYTFHLDGDRTFSCTPNQLLLTDRGWVAAQDIAEGDDILSVEDTAD